MANYKRKKPRSQVRCTMCTPNREYGNGRDRFPKQDRRRNNLKALRLREEEPQKHQKEEKLMGKNFNPQKQARAVRCLTENRQLSLEVRKQIESARLADLNRARETSFRSKMAKAKTCPCCSRAKLGKFSADPIGRYREVCESCTAIRQDCADKQAEKGFAV